MSHTAAIFDIDGVIVDSGPIHLQAWKEVLKNHGIIADDMEFRRLFGMRDSEVIPRLIENNSDEQVKEFMREKSLVFKGFITNIARPIPGVVECIERLLAHDIHLAFASLATPEEIATILKKVGLEDRVPVVVTGENPMRDKPAPDIFLTAAYRMGIEPENIVVFEDDIAGVEAARIAGATAIAITTSYAPGELSHADLVIQDFLDPKIYQFFNM
ncbi:MAG: HAD family phosphatase [Candidatus Kerfeldbacteria bacterium]|nr:HAD family phosphatase [Candidatus Kerfeldbacteria bacterium]